MLLYLDIPVLIWLNRDIATVRPHDWRICRACFVLVQHHFTFSFPIEVGMEIRLPYNDGA